MFLCSKHLEVVLDHTASLLKLYLIVFPMLIIHKTLNIFEYVGSLVKTQDRGKFWTNMPISKDGYFHIYLIA